MSYIVLVIMVISGVAWLVGFIRASRFALKHKEKIGNTVAQSFWWLRLLSTNGYGQEQEAERRKHALGFFGPLALIFICIGLLHLTA